MPRYIVRRSKNDTKVLFGRAARRVGRQPLGECLAIGNGNGTINIKNLVETDSRGADFFELKNITHTDFWTRSFDIDRKLAGSDAQIGGHTSESDVVAGLNEILGSGISRALSPVISGTMGVVNLGTEKGTDGTLSDILDEASNTFILESGSDTIVLTHGDGTTTDVDARNVGGVGNPVTSGAVSGTNLVLTLNDSSQVTIDATKMINGTEAVIDLPNWYQTYANPGTGDATAGAQLGSLTPLLNTGPWYFGQSLARGEEFLFDHTSTSQSYWLGIWGGGTTYTTTAVGTGSYWTKSLRFASTDVVSAAGSGNATKGFDITADYDVVQGSTKFALVYDHTSMKLQLWERHTGANHAEHRTLVTTANVAEDGNPVTISAAYHVLGADIPSMTKREHTWSIHAQLNAGADTTWRDGFLVDTIIKHGTGLHPGEKMTTTTPTAWLGHYLGFAYTGALTGNTNAENDLTFSLQCASTERLYEKAGFTINTKATLYDTSNHTAVIGGKTISIRYHLDNSCDIFDELNQEVLFTKNTNFDGSPQYLCLAFSANINFISYIFHDWTFSPFGPTWYGHSASKYKPNLRFHPTQLDGGNQYSWGELMYPGQELVWNFSNVNHNTFFGTRNPANTAWIKYLKMTQNKVNATDQVGWDIATNYSGGYTLTGKTVSLRYTYGDKKLRFYDITTVGVETLISTANVAEDGNAIRISIAGNGLVPQAESLRYYGWEYKHTPTNFPQPWKNWRVNRPTVNQIKIDTALTSRRALIPGYYMRWRTGTSWINSFMGQWKSANAASGLSNIEATHSFWDWGAKFNNAERVRALLGMTFNTSNTNYAANSGDPYWQDPNPGTTEIQWRYHATGKVDLHDHTNNAIIATKDTNASGGIYLTFGFGAGVTEAQLTDDFLGGGDPTIATSTFSPTFTTAPSMGYDDDGILNATEMVKMDTTVPVGKRMIISPEFWGLLEDMGGVLSSGPAVDGTGWVEDDVVVIGWQKGNSPHVGTNIGNTNSGWDAAMYMLLRSAGTNHTSRIAIYSPGNAAFTSRDGRVGSHYYTDLYYTFDRIATNSGRIMAFPSLAHARAGIAGTSPETTWFANSNDVYMTGNAQTLTLTGDLNIYIYSHVGNFTLPTSTTDCVEIITIPT